MALHRTVHLPEGYIPDTIESNKDLHKDYLLIQTTGFSLFAPTVHANTGIRVQLEMIK